MFEIKHLKTLVSIEKTGNIRKAADALFVSQSALSHQLKELEQRLKTSLFIRNTSPVQFTAQGELLLELANEILPKIDTVLAILKADKTTAVTLNLAIACHACFQWLLPVTEQFSKKFPDLKIEFLEQVFPTEFDNKTATNIDVLFTDEKIISDGFTYHALGTFEVVAVLAKENKMKNNKLTSKPFLTAADFSQQVLLTYPVKLEQLDIFKLFLKTEANLANGNHKPKAIKQVANSHMILQMVAANMGIATMPDWLVNSLTKQSLVQTKRIGEQGIFKTLYARFQTQGENLELIKQLIPETVAAFNNLYHT